MQDHEYEGISEINIAFKYYEKIYKHQALYYEEAPPPH